MANSFEYDSLKQISQEYPWSSYAEYIGYSCIADTTFVLEIFVPNAEKERKLFTEYMDENGENDFELKSKYRLTDEEAKQIMKEKLGSLEVNELLSMEKEKRDSYLRQLKENEGISIVARMATLLLRWLL